MNIPFVDLSKQYQSIKSEIDLAMQSVIEDTAFIQGKYVKSFEREFAQVNNVSHCISCANGTDAIYIALKALGIGPGDEVITVANTWISTAETITQTGAKAVFVDIDPRFYTIDVAKIEAQITSKTKAIIPVHLFGQPADMDSIVRICNEYNLFLVEDCAQSHLAEWDGKKVGTFGVAGTFSFFPGKNLGAYGDAGGIITNDDVLAEKMRMYANHGALIKHQHKIEGINSRMDGLQAAILSAKLSYLPDWSNSRLEAAKKYNGIFKDIPGIVYPEIRENVKHVFHLYVVRVKNRTGLQEFLKQNDISTGIHYPCPLPYLEAYKYMGHTAEDFPVAYSYKDEILSLPMFPEITSDQIEYVTANIKKFLL